jgi:micrococcal nuclease
MKKTTYLKVLCLCLAVLGLFVLTAAENGDTVYVTNSGEKYHRGTCSALSRSKIAVSLKDAVQSGYAPCGICKPPVLAGNSTAGAKSGGAAAPDRAPETGLYRVNTAGLASSADANIRQMVKAEVVAHVDGDTVRVRIINPAAGLGTVETIRMLGVDTPETVHPSKPVERFGKEASDFTRLRLFNKTVYLAFDWDLRDRYGRLLAYIYTADGACFNAVLIREGYAYAYTRFAFQFAEEFRALEREARQAKRGLWRGQ